MPDPFLHPFTPPRREGFITIVGGEGSVVWDDEGNRYLDGMASLWYANVGHGRRDLARAIAVQAEAMAGYHTYAPFTNRPADELAAKVAGLSPFDEPRVFFASSGSGAVDSAIKLARIAHREAGEGDRHLVVSRGRGYHGSNYGGTSIQGLPPNLEGFGPMLPGVVNVAPDDEEAMKQVFADHGPEIAAVVTEPVQGASGVWPPHPGYLEHLRDLCDAHGAYLVFDEVITGFGRLGTWFAAQYYGVTPDLITFAKAITSGYVPLSGVIVGPAPRAALEANEGFLLRTGYTYSGHPLACAAGLENLAIHEREGLLERAVRIGEILESGLGSLLDRGLVAEVRGAGAVWGVSVLDGQSPDEARDRLLGEGVIVRPIPPSHLAICPPLVTTDEQAGEIVAALERVLSR